MHIPDGFINAPTAVATGLVSMGGVSYALRVSKQRLSERQVPLIGLTAAFVFAVQMVNFPIGLGTSGHLLGGALAAILLGPWMSALVMAVVLLVQAIGFADGGITALGANVSLMGLLAGVGGYWLFRLLVAVLPKNRKGFMTAVAVTAWASVVGASALASVFLLLNGFPPVTLPVMAGLHMLIGVGEAAITTAVIGAVLSTRPDLMATAALLPTDAHRVRRAQRRPAGFVLVGLGVSLLIAVVLSGFADPNPDGLESAVLKTSCAGDVACLTELAGDPVYGAAVLPDYQITPLSGLVGVGAAFTAAAGAVLTSRRRRRLVTTPAPERVDANV